MQYCSPCPASSPCKAILKDLPPICCCCSSERSKLLPQPQSRPLAPLPKNLVSVCAPNMQSWLTDHQGNLLPWKQIMKTPTPAVGMGSRSWRRAQLCSLLLGTIGVSKGRVSCRAGEGEANFYSPVSITSSSVEVENCSQRANLPTHPSAATTAHGVLLEALSHAFLPSMPQVLWPWLPGQPLVPGPGTVRHGLAEV